MVTILTIHKNNLTFYLLFIKILILMYSNLMK